MSPPATTPARPGGSSSTTHAPHPTILGSGAYFFAFSLLLLAAAAIRVAIALRPIELIDGLTIPDDAYLSLSLARGIAHGLGPWLSGGYTNGFQPLYVFLVAPFFWLFAGDEIAPARAALFFLIACDALGLALLMGWLRRMTRGITAPLLAGAAWAFNPLVITTTLNGLETMLATLTLIAALAYFYRNFWLEPGRITEGRSIKLGLLIGLAALARLDGAFLLPAMLLPLARKMWRDNWGLIPWLQHASITCMAALLTVTPWLLYSYYYTGLLCPISGRAVRFLRLASVNQQPTWENFYRHSMLDGLATILTWHTPLLILLAVLIVPALLVARRVGLPAWERLARHAPLVLFGVIVYLAYTLYVFGDRSLARYLFPILLPIIVLTAECAAMLVETTRPRRALAWLLIIAAGAMHASLPQFRGHFTHDNGKLLGYMNLGLWASKYFPDGTVIGAAQSGALDYFATNLRVINLDGVVNPACHEALRRRHALDYARGAGVRFVVGWEEDIRFLRDHSQNIRPGDMEPVGKIPDFYSWGRAWELYRINYPPSNAWEIRPRLPGDSLGDAPALK